MIDNETFNKLSEEYSKLNLEKGLMPLVKKFFLIPENKGYCKPKVNEVLQRLISKKAVTKSDMAVFCFSIFENEEIYKRFLVTLPDALKTLISELLWKESISDEEAAIFLKEPVTKDFNLAFGAAYRSSQDRELRNEFYIFSVFKRQLYSYTGGNIFTLSLTTCLKRLLINYYPKPKDYYFIPLDTVPATTFRFNAENLIQDELHRVLSYFMQNGIKYSNKGRPSEATLNRFQKTAKIKEYFLDVPDIAGKMRSMLIAGLLFNFKANNISIDTLAVLKNLFQKHYCKQTTSQFILMYLKGWAYLNNYDYNPNAETEFLAIIKQLPVDNKWVSMENLMGFMQTRTLLIKPINDYSLHNRLYYEFKDSTYRGYLEKKYLYGKEFLLVNKPFIEGSLFLFAAFGLIEIAYNYPDFKEFPKTFYSGFDELEYIKLTPLGAYILGLSDVYEPTGGIQKNTLKLSEDSLMILAEGDAAVFEIMMAKFAEKAGANRFKVSQAHFLKDCSNQNDIFKKIQLFKKTIAEQLPVFWEIQFTTWQINSFKISEDITTKLYKIPPDEKDLQRLIAQDEVLKKLILKAEQFYILVPTGNNSKFKARMKELGYLVE
jgi:hypothetical protein